MAGRRALWALALLGAGILYFFENNIGTRTALLSVLLIPPVSLLLARWAARDVRAALQAPEQVSAGEDVRVLCRLRGRKILSFCPMTAFVRCENPLTGERAALELPVTGGRDTAFAIAEARCGRCVVALYEASLTDWFGLWRVSLPLAAEASILVLPACDPVTVTWEPFNEDGSDGSAGMHRLSHPEGGDVRPYVPGDPLRRIHWKLTAKTGQPLLRETPFEPQSDILLMLETSLEAPDPEAVDEIVRALLSVSCALAEGAERHEVCWYDHAEERLCRFVVCGEGDFLLMREALLSSATAVGGESVGALFARELPAFGAHHIALFGPHPHTNTAEFEGRTLTLVLPGDQADVPAEGGLRVCGAPGKGAWLTL